MATARPSSDLTDYTLICTTQLILVMAKIGLIFHAFSDHDSILQ